MNADERRPTQLREIARPINFEVSIPTLTLRLLTCGSWVRSNFSFLADMRSYRILSCRELPCPLCKCS